VQYFDAAAIPAERKTSGASLTGKHASTLKSEESRTLRKYQSRDYRDLASRSTCISFHLFPFPPPCWSLQQSSRSDNRFLAIVTAAYWL